jgi:putative tryptophan/tyrosine transport system substrate-binding protein
MSGGRMKRRDFLTAVAGAATWSRPARAAQRRDAVIGYLVHSTLLPDKMFWKGLADHGYVRGQNLRVDVREAHDDVGRLRELARELVRLNVSVIVVPSSGPAVHAAKAATKSIPIIFFNSGDPILMGYVPSLSRPGGNVTGVSDFGVALTAKRLELLKLLVPTTSRVAILITRNHPGLVRELEDARKSASSLSIEPVEPVLGDQREIDAAFATFAQSRVDGVCLTPSPVFFRQRAQIVALAARYRVPAVYPYIQVPQIGGLMSYGIDVAQRSYEAGVYTARVLDGANPADLPVRRMTKFELALNMTTAKTLGLAVPANFLALTDRVIE